MVLLGDRELLSDLDGIGDERRFVRRYGRRGLPAECGPENPVHLSILGRPIAYERNALSLRFLERHIAITRLPGGQGPARSARCNVLERVGRPYPFHHA